MINKNVAKDAACLSMLLRSVKPKHVVDKKVKFRQICRQKLIFTEKSPSIYNGEIFTYGQKQVLL